MRSRAKPYKGLNLLNIFSDTGFSSEGLDRAVRGGSSVVGRLFRGCLGNSLDGDEVVLPIRRLLEEARVCNRRSKQVTPLEKGGISGA